MIERVNLRDKLASFTDTWRPRVVGELNDQQVRVARLEGAYVWHHHTAEDELFLVLEGRLRIELRDGAVELTPGELTIVPRGVEHRPVALEPTSVLLFEPASTRPTGLVDEARSVEPDELERI